MAQAKLLKHFPSLPKDEEVVGDCSCAYAESAHGVPQQGHLWVTRHHLCFHAKILSRKTLIQLRLEDVKALEKQNTAYVVPNAMLVITRDNKKYFFTSLMHRDQTYDIIHGLVRPQHTPDESSKSSPIPPAGSDQSTIVAEEGPYGKKAERLEEEKQEEQPKEQERQIKDEMLTGKEESDGEEEERSEGEDKQEDQPKEQECLIKDEMLTGKEESDGGEEEEERKKVAAEIEAFRLMHEEEMRKIRVKKEEEEQRQQKQAREEERVRAEAASLRTPPPLTSAKKPEKAVQSISSPQKHYEGPVEELLYKYQTSVLLFAIMLLLVLWSLL